MNFRYLSVLSVVLAVAIVQPLQAQSSRNSTVPAEFPPASYKGAQYVDSKGCVFIRAGIDGNVTWVPRLTRSRTQICGAQPTQIAGATTEAPTAAAPEVEQITVDTPAPAPAPKPAATAPKSPKVAIVPKAPKPVARRTAQKPKPVVRTKTRSPAKVRKPEPTQITINRPVATAPAAVGKTVPARVIAQGAGACSGASAISQRYINNGKKHPVRCGPQAGGSFASVAPAPSAPRATRVAKAKPVPSTSLPGSTRVIPKHLANNRVRAGEFTVPEGYRPAWTDDRLNPRRAEGTLAGRDQMNLIWTRTVPRRLIDSSTGRDMTARVALVYPYTDLDVQRRELGQVTLITRNGQTLKKIVRNPGAPSVKQLAAQPPKQRSVVATRSQKPKAVKKQVHQPQASGGRYVQVGMFSVAQNASNTAARLQSLGLPVRMGTYTKGARSFRVVLAGPFADSGQANSALKTVRRSGFGDAFLRR